MVWRRSREGLGNCGVEVWVYLYLIYTNTLVGILNITRLHALSGQCDSMGDATERRNHSLLMHREAGGILAGSVEVGDWTGMGGVCGSLGSVPCRALPLPRRIRPIHLHSPGGSSCICLPAHAFLHGTCGGNWSLSWARSGPGVPFKEDTKGTHDMRVQTGPGGDQRASARMGVMVRLACPWGAGWGGHVGGGCRVQKAAAMALAWAGSVQQAGLGLACGGS